MENKGFLLVLMQPPLAFEDEFNAWYDTEHVPERLAVPGFETALRFVCLSGAPRYLAMYDMESPAVLDSEAYLRVSFDRSSPWTKRVTSRVKVYRSAGRQVYPGTAITTATELQELCLHSFLYCGGPASLDAFHTIKTALPEIEALERAAADKAD